MNKSRPSEVVLWGVTNSWISGRVAVQTPPDECVRQWTNYDPRKLGIYV